MIGSVFSVKDRLEGPHCRCAIQILFGQLCSQPCWQNEPTCCHNLACASTTDKMSHIYNITSIKKDAVENALSIVLSS